MLRLRARLVRGVVSTDDILPARYKHESVDPAFLAQHVFEHFEGFAGGALEAADAIVADDLFGLGSSREQAVSALKAAGVHAVFAPAFGRIFFRNAWNLAMPAIQIALPSITDGDALLFDLEGGTIEACGVVHRFPPVMPEVLAIYEAGGLLERIQMERRAAIGER
jgi:3-isopropylmalate/(R)-2-methylmalate dehydratase small subunit